MNRLYLLFLLLSFSLNLPAQRGTIELSGTVVDVTSKSGLKNVSISVEGILSKGTATDNEGRFLIKVDTLPVTLIISSIGFETRKVLVQKNTALMIELINAITDLPEIVVSGSRKIDTVYHEPYNVVDYVFKDDFLVLLVYKNIFQKYQLVLLDENEKYLSHFSLKEYNPATLFKSCREDIFLTTAYGVYYIKIEEEEVSLGKWVDNEKYEQVIEPCVLYMDSMFFYRRHFYQGQALRYYAFKEQAGKIDSFAILPLIEDEANIIRLVEETGNRLPWSGDLWDDDVSGGLRFIREAPYFLKGKLMIYNPPIYAPIIQKDTTICLFNHQASAIQYFDTEGNQVKEVPIQYHKRKHWKKYILHDQLTEEVYTAFHTRWGEYICQVDLETGALSEAVPLDLDFIDHVSIRDGVLYFLHRDPYANVSNRMIQKVRVN